MKQAMTIRISEELHQRLKFEAQRRGMTLNAYINSILWEMSENKNALSSI